MQPSPRKSQPYDLRAKCDRDAATPPERPSGDTTEHGSHPAPARATLADSLAPPVPPTADDIRKLVDFIAIFEAPGFVAGRWVSEPGTFPYVVQHPQVTAFVSAIGVRCFTYAFDWRAWAKEAEAFFQDPSLLETAPLETIWRLFFTLIRKDRFTEGTLVAALQNGLVTAALRRLEHLAGRDADPIDEGFAPEF